MLHISSRRLRHERHVVQDRGGPSFGYELGRGLGHCRQHLRSVPSADAGPDDHANSNPHRVANRHANADADVSVPDPGAEPGAEPRAIGSAHGRAVGVADPGAVFGADVFANVSANTSAKPDAVVSANASSNVVIAIYGSESIADTVADDDATFANADTEAFSDPRTHAVADAYSHADTSTVYRRADYYTGASSRSARFQRSCDLYRWWTFPCCVCRIGTVPSSEATK